MPLGTLRHGEGGAFAFVWETEERGLALVLQRLLGDVPGRVPHPQRKRV